MLETGKLRKEDYIIRKAPYGEIKFPSVFSEAGISQQVLQNNTLYPLAAVMGLADKAATILTPTANWKVCAQCVFEDIDCYGVAYVRRHNTIKSVQLCSKHATQLLSSCPACKKTIAQHSNMGFRTCSEQYGVEDINIFFDSPRHMFSRFIEGLLEYDGKPCSLSVAGIIILHKLLAMGYRLSRMQLDLDRVNRECNYLLGIESVNSEFFLRSTTLSIYVEMAFLAFREPGSYLFSLTDRDVWKTLEEEVRWGLTP